MFSRGLIVTLFSFKWNYRQLTFGIRHLLNPLVRFFLFFKLTRLRLISNMYVIRNFLPIQIFNWKSKNCMRCRSDYIHSKGLKVGTLFCTAWIVVCLLLILHIGLRKSYVRVPTILHRCLKLSILSLYLIQMHTYI